MRKVLWARVVILSGFTCLLLLLTRFFTSIPQLYFMTGPSMVPAVGQGAWFVARPLGAPPQRGDLVIVALAIDDTVYDVLRRVVGLAGDTVAMSGGVLAVNGRTAPWPARVVNPAANRVLDGPIRGTIYDWGPVTVGADSVFVLSDSRDMFGWPDSRFLGGLPRQQIVAGRVRVLVRGEMTVP